jgi:hypothetical protein
MAKATRTVFLAPVEHITRSILILRGQRVILDSDLAAIYGVSTGRFNEAVKRNIERFPEDFMLRLSASEYAVASASPPRYKPIHLPPHSKWTREVRHELANKPSLGRRLGGSERRRRVCLLDRGPGKAGNDPLAKGASASSKITTVDDVPSETISPSSHRIRLIDLRAASVYIQSATNHPSATQ